MKCIKCGMTFGNQSVCPFCGLDIDKHKNPKYRFLEVQEIIKQDLKDCTFSQDIYSKIITAFLIALDYDDFSKNSIYARVGTNGATLVNCKTDNRNSLYINIQNKNIDINNHELQKQVLSSTKNLPIPVVLTNGRYFNVLIKNIKHKNHFTVYNIDLLNLSDKDLSVLLKLVKGSSDKFDFAQKITKQKMSIKKKIILVVIISICSLILCIVGVGKVLTSDKSSLVQQVQQVQQKNNKENNPRVSPDEYIGISGGMTYYEVARLIGSPGIKAQERTYGDLVETIYKWQGEIENSSVEVYFRNEQVYHKIKEGF